MEERNFALNGSSLISCAEPCGKEYASQVDGDKIKELGGQTSTMRCVASGAPLRGQHHGLPQQAHGNLRACRVCTIYTPKVDNVPVER